MCKSLGKFYKALTKWPAKSIVNPMAVLKGSVFWTLGLYSCPNSSKLHDGCLSNFQHCPSGCLLHSGRLLFLAKSDFLVGNSIRSVIRYLRVHYIYHFPRLFQSRNLIREWSQGNISDQGIQPEDSFMKQNSLSSLKYTLSFCNEHFLKRKAN